MSNFLKGDIVVCGTDVGDNIKIGKGYEIIESDNYNVWIRDDEGIPRLRNGNHYRNESR